MERVKVDEWAHQDGSVEVWQVHEGVVKLVQDVTDQPQTVWLTRDEWARVGKAMGWTA